MANLPRRCLRLLSPLLCVCLLWTSTAVAATPLDAATAKQQIGTHGVGKVIRLNRRDATEIKGAIVSLGEESCVLQVLKQPEPVTVSYAEVTKVRGPGMSHGLKVGLIVGASVVAAVAITAIVIYKHTGINFPPNLQL